MRKIRSIRQRIRVLVRACLLATGLLLVTTPEEAGADACPTDNPLINVNFPNLSGCGVTPERALGKALIEASGVVCDLCPNDEKCTTLVEFTGEMLGAEWTIVEVEILGVKITFHCFTNGAVVGKLSVDCDECPPAA